MEGKYLLPFAADPRIGSQSLKKALAVFDSPLQLWKAPESEIKHKLNERVAGLLVEARSKSDPETELEKLSKLDIGYMTIYDSEYPEILREICDHPAVLFIRGNVKALKKLCLAVVGSRKYSNYGAKVTKDLAFRAAENGLVIVSGLALGIDAVAHQAALDASGLTVGVLGCGLDRIYPVANYRLGEKIIDSGGAIISEFPIGTVPMRQNFPIRNRVIAGLSQGTLVIEAAEDSGSLITANLALEYNREVFAVPGNIDSPNSAGTNKLIKAGAIPVTEIADILSVLNIAEKNHQDKAKEILPESPEEKIIYDILISGAKSGTELIELSKINVISLNSILTAMEMKGTVENVGGGRYQLK